MKLIHLQYFLAVARWENITRAAEELHVSQPTISQAMRELEADTGLRLLRHAGRRVELTADGRRLKEKAKPVVAGFSSLEDTVQEMAKSRNHIRAAVPLQIGVRLLPALLGEFHEKHPEIRLDISESGGIEALRMLEADELDIAVTNFDGGRRNTLSYKKLGDVECCFCTYEGHPLAEKTSVTFEDIAQEPLVFLDGGFFVGGLVEREFTRRHIIPQVLLYTGQLHTVKNLVRQGVASTVLTRQAVRPTEGVRMIPFEPKLMIASGYVLKKGAQTFEAERSFIDFVKEQFNGNAEEK